MNWTDIIGNVASGGLLGLVGNVASFGMNWFKSKQEFEHQTKMLQLQSEAKTAEAASAIAVAREQGAAAAFTASIQAEGLISGEHKWAKTFRAITRPGLTWAGLVSSIICGLFSIENDLVMATNIYTGMMISWWFGQRQIEKSSIRWGSGITKGSVSSGATQ
jgi:hypothetical protein